MKFLTILPLLLSGLALTNALPAALPSEVSIADDASAAAAAAANPDLAIPLDAAIEPIASFDNSTLSKRASPTSFSYPNNWHFPGGVAASGSSLVVFNSNGNVRFQTHFHASGAATYNYGISCALRDADGRAYALSRTGTIHGTFSPGSRDSDADQTRYNADVQRNWARIVQSNTLHCRTKMNWSIVALLGEVLDIIKTIGPIVGAVISIF
ncbi:hypothetical protein EJ06DRAFT_256220 [Trichodelitschia bisporula]|uniref:Uncharacterized protein n=1 Tax=Trichodelitschia bisporula TaxID=703511 RepID=A0A6G1HIF3_9PEZI|nr:hypothetical protein EJ06DRAFT_256220 [Trichodelitschia bisporula]